MPYFNKPSDAAGKGFIQAMSALHVVMQQAYDSGQLPEEPISFGAGLPDRTHKMSPKVTARLKEAADEDTSPYSKYDLKSNTTPTAIRPAIADYHNTAFGTHFRPEDVAFSMGSTPVLAASAYTTMTPGAKASAFHPSYSQFPQSVEACGGVMDITARLVSEADICPETGKPYQANGRWMVDEPSFNTMLNNNRRPPKEGGLGLLYLNFPGNPTGYAPTPDEYKHIADLLADEAAKRREQGLDMPLILEDMAYATMRHDGKPYYSLHKALDDAQKDHPERAQDYEDVRMASATAHSFSKAFAAAGERIAYFASDNPEIIRQLQSKIYEWSLTPSRMAPAAMQGALDTGEPDKDAMAEYAKRENMFEDGMNALPRDNNTPTPVPARADAGFFCTVDARFLIGRQLNATQQSAAKGFIDGISDPALRNEFDGVLPEGRITDAASAAVALALYGAIATPIVSRDATDIKLRFSVGQTDEKAIQEGLKRMKTMLQETEPTPARYSKRLRGESPAEEAEPQEKEPVAKRLRSGNAYAR